MSMRGYRELVKVWRKSGFTLRLWWVRGALCEKERLAYELKDGRRVIFTGEDFYCSPLHSVDSLDTVYSLLSFLSLQPGDTDREYFDNYTPEQMVWCRSDRCAELGHIRYELEEGRG